MDCLQSLSQQTYPNLRILVVDNASTDGSSEKITERFPQVEQICNTSNLGFAKGFNTGLRYALNHEMNFVFILNNDAIVAPDCLTNLMEHVDGDPGILGPIIFYANHPQKIWSAGGNIRRLILEKSEELDDQLDPGNLPEVLERDFITGCGMLFSRKSLEMVGLFDEDFSMYYEDSDLCWRTRHAGRRILVVPSAKMWHKVATSSGGSDAPNERYWMARSSIRFFRKHARGGQIPAVLFWRTFSALRTTFRLARQQKWSALHSYWRGLKDGILDALGEVKQSPA